MPSRAARKIENRVDPATFHVRSNEVYRASRIGFVAVRIEAQILIAESLLEPVGGLRRARMGARSVSHDHLWYGSPRTIVPAR